MDRSRFPFNACLQDLQIRRLSGPAGGQSARPDVSPVADNAVVSVPDDHRSEQVAGFARPALGYTAT